MIVNNAFVSFKVVSPEAEKQLFPAVDPSFVFHQKKKDLVFLWRKKTILAVHKDLLFASVDPNWTLFIDVRIASYSVKECFRLGIEHFEGKRFGDIIIRPLRISGQLVFFAYSGRQKNDRAGIDLPDPAA